MKNATFKNIILTLLAVALSLAVASAEVINDAGQEVDITDHVVRGKVTIVDFFSDKCGPCHSMGDLLTVLEGLEEGVVVKRVDIDRPGSDSIDWESPVVKQYGITSVPYLAIFDDEGDLVLHGDEAREFVVEYFQSQLED